MTTNKPAPKPIPEGIRVWSKAQPDYDKRMRLMGAAAREHLGIMEALGRNYRLQLEPVQGRLL